MANCNPQFLQFNQDLVIPKEKRDRLTVSRDNCEKRIRKWFNENQPEYTPKFKIQGSYKMKTMIITKDDTCDLDDGVYFLREKGVCGTTLQKWIKQALDGHVTEPIQHRIKCVRIVYKADYHIDFPVYYFEPDADHPEIAIKDKNCEESDPKEVLEWYDGEKRKDAQINKLCKYFKAWGDHVRNKMPSGLAMMTLCTDNFVGNDRDDIALKETLIKVQKTLEDTFECIVHGAPNDDLFSDYDQDRQKRFMDRLDDFITDAKKAIDDESNQEKASRIWKKYLGERFPLGQDINTDEEESALESKKNTILSQAAFLNKKGEISDNNNGVQHKPHRNFGG